MMNEEYAFENSWVLAHNEIEEQLGKRLGLDEDVYMEDLVVEHFEDKFEDMSYKEFKDLEYELMSRGIAVLVNQDEDDDDYKIEIANEEEIAAKYLGTDFRVMALGKWWPEVDESLHEVVNSVRWVKIVD